MKELLTELGFNLEAIRRACIVQSGIGQGYLAQASEVAYDRRRDFLEFGATCLRKAAAHAVLVDDQNMSRELYRKCAAAYVQLGRPYALMMWTLGRDQKIAEDYLRHNWFSPDDPEQRSLPGLREQTAYSLLYASGFNTVLERIPTSRERERVAVVRDRLQVELEASSDSPIGVLGIPVIHYVNLARSLEEGNSKSRILEALFPFVATYDLAVRTVLSKKDHWMSLRLPFHPAEPDILAVMSIADIALRRFQFSLIEWMNDLPLMPVSRSLLQEALRVHLDDSSEPSENHGFTRG